MLTPVMLILGPGLGFAIGWSWPWLTGSKTADEFAAHFKDKVDSVQASTATTQCMMFHSR